MDKDYHKMLSTGEESPCVRTRDKTNMLRMPRPPVEARVVTLALDRESFVLP